jgi:prepilin-type N-terminal cleavage/methylation domain-containing protein/prepilin-type processing-associated H-X9-DG protein
MRLRRVHVRNHHRHHQSGFTLVELLVVIAIIGTLVATLLPAVQAAREAARRSECVGHLRQIGIANENYAHVHRSFPAGSDLPKMKSTFLLRLLPFVEQQALYDLYDLQTFTDNQVFPGTTTKLASTVIPLYICPSDDHEPVLNVDPALGPMGSQNYAASDGPGPIPDNAAASCPHNWDIFALAPYWDPRNFAGPFCRYGATVRPKQITDGLSKTIFFGETRPNCCYSTAFGWAASHNSQGLYSTIYPINFDTCSLDPAEPDGCKNWKNWNLAFGFKSAHPGGANFCFGDGSVTFISDTIDHWTYQYLGAKADGHSASIPD